jgi:hypothetical protein
LRLESGLRHSSPYSGHHRSAVKGAATDGKQAFRKRVRRVPTTVLHGSNSCSETSRSLRRSAGHGTLLRPWSNRGPGLHDTPRNPWRSEGKGHS